MGIGLGIGILMKWELNLEQEFKWNDDRTWNRNPNEMGIELGIGIQMKWVLNLE